MVNSHMRDTFMPFVRKSVAINATFLAFFERRLQLPPGEFARIHAADRINGGEARCVRTPPRQQSVGIGAHTDFGSLVSTRPAPDRASRPRRSPRVSGDRAQPPRRAAGPAARVGAVALHQGRCPPRQCDMCGTAADARRQPVPGYAVCNIGDALAIFSANILRSNVHRVM